MPALDPQMYRPLPHSSQVHDLKLVRELTAMVRQVVGTLRPRALIEGVNDGSVPERDFQMGLSDTPREEALAAHKQGFHRPPYSAQPKLDCPQCQARLAGFRRRQLARMDVVVALGSHCAICHEPVMARAARFVHRRGHRSHITQMLQWSYAELMEAARDYALLCPRCSGNGGRQQILARERAQIPIGIAPPRPPRADKGRKRKYA